MIGYLKGKLISIQENTVILNVNGVGYQVEVANMGSVSRKGEELELYIYTYVREDALALYGFNQPEEKELFKTLLGISGIGPKAAINILSSLSYDTFVNAILTENSAVLKQISGIGPKTASRLILELKNKVEKFAINNGMVLDQTSRDEEIYEALQGLGYSLSEIDKALSELKLDKDLSLDLKLKKILSYLGKER